MRTELFDYDLPEHLIADRPPAARGGGRLLVLRQSGVEHRCIAELPDLIAPASLVVVNETRVIRARLLGQRSPGGGRVELFLLECVGSEGVEAETWRALARANRPLRPETTVSLGGLEAEVLSRGVGGVLEVKLRSARGVRQSIEELGHVPLPPYVRRADEPMDAERYQTVFARRDGSVAAPTAGLHFTQEMLARLEARGVEVGAVTLHVGLGTFRPVSAVDLDDHEMHSERYEVPSSLAAQVESARGRDGKVVAIGTTVVRALESANDPERPRHVRAASGETRLLIQPGYRFGSVDALLTNFHMPKSTLMALVAAFAGTERTLAAYAEAVREGYRFLSYGDAMWIPERLT
jgi:S-adenosylmethionine:tRNA ribosyltransferase-isomerase